MHIINKGNSLHFKYKKIWIIERPYSNGRLCNRLGLFAHFVAFCIEHDGFLINLNFAEYSENFKNINSGIISFYPKKEVNIPWNWLTYYLFKTGVFLLKKHPSSFYLEEELQVNEIITKDNCFDLQELEVDKSKKHIKFFFCKGWRFRCYDLVAKHAKVLRDVFQPNEVIENWTLERLQKVKPKETIIIAVHMRLGDYRYHWNGRFCFSIDIYKRLMLSVENLFSKQYNVKFLLFSDESQSLDLFEEFNVDLSGGTALQDLYLMSKCNYIIGPPSSFSNWASFYGKVPLWHIQQGNIEPQLNDFKVYLPLDICVA
jgi:hypothetical protein